MSIQAIILAAGRGSRLDTVSGGLPKCLLEIGGRSLIEHQLEALADAGIGPVALVVGYRAEDVRNAVGSRAVCVRNERWEETNSLFSFWTARESVRGPVVIANSDLLFHPEILDRLLEGEGSALAYDSVSGEGGEHMKVVVEGGCVTDVAKDLPRDRAAGENVGLVRLDADAARRTFEHADALLRNGREKGWLAEAVRATAVEMPIRGVDVAGLPWAEIDFPYDLDRARREVWPAIHRSRWGRTLRWRKTRWIALAAVCAVAVTSGWWLGSPSADWDTVPAAGGEKVTLTLGSETQKWWLLQEGQVVQAQVDGPEPVRIECRAVLSADAAEEVPFMVEIALDNRPVKWRAFHAKPASEAWFREGVAVGDRERIEMVIPAGPHALRIRQAAGATRGCLIRVRQPQMAE